MRNVILSLFFGCLFASLLFGFIITPHYAQQRFEQGIRQGKINANREMIERIPTVLGDDYRKADGYETFITAKDMSVVIVERNGVKTLRTYDASAR